MARTTSFSQVLWLMTTAWLAACGRLGFDDGNDGLGNHLPDAAVTRDAAELDAPVGPKVVVAGMPVMTAECGMTATSYDLKLSNPGDQDLVITEATLGDLVVQVAPGGGAGARSLPAAGSGSSAGGYQVLTALPLTIPAGGTAVVRVQPPDSVTGTDRAKSTKTSRLTLTTNAPGDEAFAIDLVSTVTGANIDVAVVGGGGLTMNLTGTSGACPAPRSIQVTNSGTLVAQVNMTVSSGSGIGATYSSGFTSGAVTPGAPQTTTFRPFTSSACTINGGQVTFSTGGASGVCTDPVTVTVNLNITGASSGCFCS